MCHFQWTSSSTSKMKGKGLTSRSLAVLNHSKLLNISHFLISLKRISMIILRSPVSILTTSSVNEWSTVHIDSLQLHSRELDLVSPETESSLLLIYKFKRSVKCESEINIKIREHMLRVLKEADITGFLSMGAALSITTGDICACAKLSERKALSQTITQTLSSTWSCGNPAIQKHLPANTICSLMLQQHDSELCTGSI